jgi:DNA-binding winged helix-turn-helix (wHTH) protein
MNLGRKTPKNPEIPRSSVRYVFSPFELDPIRQLLFKDGEPVQLNPRAFEILRVLVENRDRLVTKEDLMSAVWGDTAVEEGNINRNISSLRRALGEDPEDHRFILTVPRQGYRFVAEVNLPSGAGNSHVMALLSNAKLQDASASLPPSSVGNRRAFAARLALVAAAALIVLYIALPFGRSRAKTSTVSSSAADSPSPAAREYYTRGLAAWNSRGQKASDDAIVDMKQATALDPTYAEAWAGLADAFILHAFYSPDDTMALPSAKSAATEALKLDDELATAHSALGAVHALYDWDWEGCEREFQRALALDPDNTQIMDWHAIICRAPRRKLDEAAAELQHALEIEPLSPNLWTDLAWVRVFQRRNSEAVDACRRALRIDPSFIQAHARLEGAYQGQGEYASVVAEDEAIGVLIRGSAPRPYPLRMTRAEYQAGLRQAMLSRARIFPPSLHDGIHWAYLGEKEKALRLIQQRANPRDPGMIYLAVDPDLDSLRDDPEFLEIERSIGILPQPGS